MKVLMLNGSCKKEGNTYNALLEIGKQLEKEGIDYEIFQTGSEPVRDCIGCGGCASGKCVYTDDAVNEFENMIKEMKQEYGSGFSKNYREMPEGEFVKSVINEMEVWMFIRKDEADHQIRICPLTGKIQGSYPEDYMGGRNDE